MLQELKTKEMQEMKGELEKGLKKALDAKHELESELERTKTDLESLRKESSALKVRLPIEIVFSS